ncbi:hypothetical protein [Vibrio sp. Hal054]|uniref:hypothetical protein n=1 Tax=Vibrio sp. Hal054 TaxID=3035158 RepID=UPI00301C616C
MSIYNDIRMILLATIAGACIAGGSYIAHADGHKGKITFLDAEQSSFDWDKSGQQGCENPSNNICKREMK